MKNLKEAIDALNTVKASVQLKQMHAEEKGYTDWVDKYQALINSYNAAVAILQSTTPEVSEEVKPQKCTCKSAKDIDYCDTVCNVKTYFNSLH